MSAYDDYRDYKNEEAEAEFWFNLPTQLHEDSVKGYLGTYGDSIDSRIKKLTEMSKALHAADFYGPSATVSSTAIEVMIAYFCVRPMVEGAFVSETWAECLAKWIARRPADQREILVAMLSLWDIDVAKILLDDGTSPLWATIQGKVFEARNRFVHRGDNVSKEQSELGIACIDVFQRKIIMQIASRLGFTLEETGCWGYVKGKSDARIPGVVIGGTRYTVRDVFTK